MITQPYINFIQPDAGGNVKPISNGKIYIGKEGIDPKLGGNPIHYIDNQGNEVEVKSPLYLNMTGVIVDGPNSSKVINPYANSPISILIEDKNGRPIYSELSYVNQTLTINEVGKYTDLSFSDINSADLSGLLKVGDLISVDSYHAGIDSGRLYFRVVASGTGVHSGFKYIDLPESGLQLEQNVRFPIQVKAAGAKGDFKRTDGTTNPNPTDDTSAFKACIEYARKSSSVIYDSFGGHYYITERLFFGPKTEADTNLQPTQSKNICPGFIGAGQNATYLYPRHNDSVGIDLSGLREKFLKMCTIDYEDAGNVPDVGLLTARLFRSSIGAPTNNDFGEISDVTIIGHNAFAPYMAHATEEIDVQRCFFYAKADTALAPWVSTCDITIDGFTPTVSTETSMSFTTGPQSNLHQTHTLCHYYHGSNNPTRSKAALAYVYGSLMTKFDNPFFNNNSHNFDCVAVDKPDSQASVFGTQIVNANFHQTVNSALRLDCANVNTSIYQSNVTVAFAEAEVIVNAFTNEFNTDYLAGDLKLLAPLENSDIRSMRSLIWDRSKSIKACSLSIRNEMKQNTTGPETFDNDFELTFNGKVQQVRGKYTLEGTAYNSTQIGVTGLPGYEVHTVYGSFDSAMYRSSFRTDSLSQYNHFEALEKGITTFSVKKGGTVSLGNGAVVELIDETTGARVEVFVNNGTIGVR